MSATVDLDDPIVASHWTEAFLVAAVTDLGEQLLAFINRLVDRVLTWWRR